MAKLSTEEKQIVLCKLFQNSIMPIVYNFLYVLNLRKRVGIISEIANEFEKELEQLKNIARVNVTSAIELTEERKEDIKSKISEKLNEHDVNIKMQNIQKILLILLVN